MSIIAIFRLATEARRVVIVGGTALVALAAAQPASTAWAADLTVSSPIQDPRSAARFATAAALQAVTPMPLWSQGASRQLSAGDLAAIIGGSPGASSGGKAAANADAVARREFAAAWKTGQNSEIGDLGDFGTVNVFDQYFWDQFASGLQKAYPGRPVGKLLFNTPSGTASCTASVVSPNNVVVTAAHCCHSRNAFYSGWTFIPSLRGTGATSEPYGRFAASRATILTSWITRGARVDDVCVLNMRSNAAGRTVTFFTGWLGRSWNQPVVGHDHSWGYPGNFGGSIFRGICSAETYASPAGSCGGTATQNMGCAMTFGASGGPWMRGFKLGQVSGFVNSVVSGFDGAACGTPFQQAYNGPYFSTGNIVPLCTAAGC